MNLLKRTIYRLIVLAAVCGLTFGLLVLTGHVSVGRASADAVSSATGQIISTDSVSGKYVIFVNKTLHDKKQTTDDWITFFSGKDVPLIMEDITCVVPSFDSKGMELAESFQSRLPENQMKIKTEAGLLAVSRAEYGKLDVMIMSEATAQAYKAYTLYNRNDIEVVTIQNGE